MINPKRLLLVLQHRLEVSGPSLLKIWGAAFGALLLLSLAITYQKPFNAPTLYAVATGFMLLLGGYLTSSAAVPEMSNRSGRLRYLTLPATSTEKWLATYLLTGPAFALVILLLILLTSFLVSGLMSLFGVAGVPVYNPWDSGLDEMLLVYFLAIHPIALIGAIAFNGLAFAKTFGIVMGLLFAFSTFMALMGWLLFGVGDDSGGDFTLISSDSDWLADLISYLVATVLVVVSWLKWQEREAV